MMKASVLRSSSGIAPVARSKVNKGHHKEIPTKAKSLNEATQFEKILMSKTDRSRSKKPGLTPEEVEKDMTLTGITSAASSKHQTHPSSALKSSIQHSSSLTTPQAQD
jgi:hypothetical protein